MTVIDISKAKRDSEPKLKPNEKFGRCRCRLFYVDNYSRTLECRECGKVSDPFDFLMKEATHQQNTVFDISHMKEEQKRLKTDIEELKRVKCNLQAQVKRMQKKELK